MTLTDFQSNPIFLSIPVVLLWAAGRFLSRLRHDVNAVPSWIPFTFVFFFDILNTSGFFFNYSTRVEKQGVEFPRFFFYFTRMCNSTWWKCLVGNNQKKMNNQRVHKLYTLPSRPNGNNCTSLLAAFPQNKKKRQQTKPKRRVWTNRNERDEKQKKSCHHLNVKTVSRPYDKWNFCFSLPSGD